MKNILPAWKEKRIVDGSIDSRKAKGTAACLAFINKYDEKQAWEIYSTLTLDKNKLTKEGKRSKVIALERVFESILKFDLSKMNYKSLNDAFINNRPELDYMAYLCFEFEPKWLDEYKKYIEDKDAGCSLNKDQFQELYNKWDLIHNCGSLMKLYREVSLIEGISEKDVEEALKLKKD